MALTVLVVGCPNVGKRTFIASLNGENATYDKSTVFMRDIKMNQDVSVTFKIS
jgi:ribosome biogenesis GTPase A